MESVDHRAEAMRLLTAAGNGSDRAALIDALCAVGHATLAVGAPNEDRRAIEALRRIEVGALETTLNELRAAVRDMLRVLDAEMLTGSRDPRWAALRRLVDGAS